MSGEKSETQKWAEAIKNSTNTYKFPKPIVSECLVPVLDGKVLVNAIGSNESEIHVNLALLDLTEEEVEKIEIVPAIVTTIV